MSNLNPSLIKAILSMDAYNRGYDAGINIDGGNSSLNSTIGNYTIKNESDVDAGTEGVNIGFYALAYEYQGQTIISYRGTDYPENDNQKIERLAA